MELPAEFETYLDTLNSKQRHEVRRKLRRLNEAGTVNYHLLDDMARIRPALDNFFSMFVESRDDKATFLTPEMKRFFLTLMEKLGEAGILRLGVLELDGSRWHLSSFSITMTAATCTTADIIRNTRG
jgi:predicted N-acyltransferase